MLKAHSEISQLAPQAVWKFFDQICSIPHPSKHEEALATFIVDWAQSKGLSVKRDETGNVFIKKPATPGMEDRKGVVLQAHIDMVSQKNNDTEHDFVTDAIQPYVDNGWVTAKDTTLGADNGIGMASCLAVLDADDIAHGPLEVLLTVHEEAGMSGAFGLQPCWLEGDILLNTDSEQEGEIYMGCAGGIDASISVNIERHSVTAQQQSYQLTLKGLRGGHSGVDIHTGRANANKLLARFLKDHCQELSVQLISLQGGTLRNAIPREASALFTMPAEQLAAFNQALRAFETTIKQELSSIETGITLVLDEVTNSQQPMTEASQRQVLNLLNACPNGVIRMSDDIQGVVETSLNMGVISTTDSQFEVLCLVRSLIDSGREQVTGSLRSLAELAGAEIKLSGAYPGWKPDPNSQVLAIFRDMYETIYGNKPDIMVIHAGLECGLFKKPYPEMDMISFGPTIKFPHSPDEKVEIDSVGLYWQQMKGILANIPIK